MMIVESSGKSLVPDFGGRFWPILGQTEEEFFSTIAKSLFNTKSSNQFYIRLCVQIFYILFCLLFKLLPFVLFINHHFLVFH